MVEALNKKLENAIKKLTTLKEVTLKSTRSSHYSFGIIKPALNDRFDITIQLDVDLSVNCQIIFDPNYIDFPPDIVFHTLPETKDITSLLPRDDWDLDREDCLYTWFKRILKLWVKKPIAVKEIQPILAKSFFDETPSKGKKRTYHDSDEDDVFSDSLPKVRKLVLSDDDMIIYSETDAEPQKTILDDHFDDFELENSKRANKSTYKNDFDDFDMEFTKWDNKAHYKNNSDDSDVQNTKLDYKAKFKDDFDDFDLDNTKLDYRAKYKDDYDNGDISSVEEVYMSTKHDEKKDYLSDEEYVSQAVKKPTTTNRTPLTKSFGSIKANLASFRKKPDIHTFSTKPFHNRVKKSIALDDDDDGIILPTVRRRESPERQTLLSLATSPQSKKQERHKAPLSQPQPKLQSKLFDLGGVKGKQDEFRKAFMTAWLTKYKDHIMVYDSRKYEYFSLLLTFRLPLMSDRWAEFKEFKAISIEKLEDKGEYIESTVMKPRPQAPIIISFKMDALTFPSSKLRLQLISVMNTSSSGSAEPDTESFEYKVNQKENIGDTIEAIMRHIRDKAPNFHLQMTKK